MSAVTRRTSPRAPAPPDAPAPTAPRTIDLFAVHGAPPRTHLEWAENIARLIARAVGKFGPRSQEADDLVSLAHLTLVRLAPRFDFARVPQGGDPDGLFRGWVHEHVRGECKREVLRLRNGGTFSSTNDRDAKGMIVGAIPDGLASLRPDGRCPSCASVMFGTDAEPIEDEEPPEDVNAWLAAHGYD